jgi:hypothetical protein
MKHAITLCGENIQLIVKPSGTCCCHWVLKGRRSLTWKPVGHRHVERSNSERAGSDTMIQNKVMLKHIPFTKVKN